MERKTAKKSDVRSNYSFYEFFAGGGMARLGLGKAFIPIFINDFDPKKASAYRANFPKSCTLMERDIHELTIGDLPGRADLAWASFPCQDLSLAGAGAGLKGDRSGTFWGFWNLMSGLCDSGRAPRVIVLENVCGAITSNYGDDFCAILKALHMKGYRFGPLVMDAIDFVPQSRPRLFIVAVRSDVQLPQRLVANTFHRWWHPLSLQFAEDVLDKALQSSWLWWKMPEPPRRGLNLEDIIEENPEGVHWHRAEETLRLLAMMTPPNREKVEMALQSGNRIVGTLYKRTRNGAQRAEVRFDGVAGCLRTPAGGSSRQTVIIVENGEIRTRLLSPREAARLMGLPDSYVLPQSYNDSYHLVGDGLAIPVVRHLAKHIIIPVLKAPVSLVSQEAA